MSTIVRYRLKYDGATFSGSRAVHRMRELSANWGFPWPNGVSIWRAMIQIFKVLPDYNKQLWVVRERRRTRRSKYRAVQRHGDRV